jgi:predicted DNA repair protein MutK
MKYICSDSVQKYDGSLVPNPDQFQTTTIVELSSEERQVRAVEQSAESVKTIANIMTGFVIVTIVLVVISVAQNI